MPFGRDSYIKVLGADPKEWAEKYDIEPFEMDCRDCGRKLKTTIPIFRGQLRGLLAPTCECGNENVPYCVVRDPKYGDLLSPPDPQVRERNKGPKRLRAKLIPFKLEGSEND